MVAVTRRKPYFCAAVFFAVAVIGVCVGVPAGAQAAETPASSGSSTQDGLAVEQPVTNGTSEVTNDTSEASSATSGVSSETPVSSSSKTGQTSTTVDTDEKTDGSTPSTSGTASGDESKQDPTPVVHETPVSEGDYVIGSSLSDGKVVDVSDSSTDDGANVQIWDSNMANGQRWSLSYDAEGRYTITNIGSGKVLDVSYGISSEGNNVWQWTSNDTDAQRWYIVSTSGGYRIVSALDESLALDVSYGSTSNGTNIGLWGVNDTAAQLFKFYTLSPKALSGTKTISDGYYEIVNASSGLVLDISNASFADGANVQVWGNNSTIAQEYCVTYDAASGCYTLVCLASGKAIDLCFGNVVPTANVQQWEANGTDAQLWAISDNSDGTFTLLNRLNGLALDVAYGSTTAGANAWTYTSNGTDAQRWTFRKVTRLLSDGTYTLYTALAPDSKVLDIPSASTSDGETIQIWDSNGGFAQKYQVRGQDSANELYTIQSLCSGMYLSVASSSSGARIIQSSTAHNWSIAFSGLGFFLTDPASGLLLDVSYASTANGAGVQLWESNNSTAQRIRFANVLIIADGCYKFATAMGGHALDIADAAFLNGKNVQIWDDNGSNAQKYDVYYQGDGYYKIVNSRSKKALDVLYAANADGANVQQWAQNGSDAQLWKACVSDAGYIYFLSKVSGDTKALDVAYARNENGANVQIYTYNNTSAQQWRLVITEYTVDNVIILDVPCPWNQYDVGLPTGCESMALTNLLLYWGFSLDPSTIADDYMPWSDEDYVYSFLGNPHSYSGGAIMSPGLTNTANDFLAAMGSGLHAYNITGTSFGDLYNYVRNGYPVIVWNTVNMGGLGNSWSEDGYTFYSGTHTVVFSGFDLPSGGVYIADSISGLIWRSASDFGSIYSDMGSQAVVIT